MTTHVAGRLGLTDRKADDRRLLASCYDTIKAGWLRAVALGHA
ncbi:hypothetical protein [Micromonospora sp. LOL_023]